MKKLSVVLLAIGLTGCLQTRRSIKDNVEIAPEAQSRAQAQAQYMDYEEQIRTMRGQIESLENSMRLMSEEKNHREVEIAEFKKEIDQRMKVYAETLNQLDTQYLALARKVELMMGAKTAVQTAKKNDNPYDAAEALFDQKKWREAIVEYQNYREKNPKGKTYPEATYKIGVCFQELGMKDEATAFYNEVVKKFSKSKSADKARYRLKNLK